MRWLILLVACQNEAAPPIFTCDGGYVVAEELTQGCRAPDEQGCEICCTPMADGCLRKTESPGEKGNPRWYNDWKSLKESCPSDCPPCAACLDRDEAELCYYLAHPQSCDCEHVVPGIDPCGAVGSCACYCERLKATSMLCPAR